MRNKKLHPSEIFVTSNDLRRCFSCVQTFCCTQIWWDLEISDSRQVQFHPQKTMGRFLVFGAARRRFWGLHWCSSTAPSPRYSDRLERGMWNGCAVSEVGIALSHTHVLKTFSIVSSFIVSFLFFSCEKWQSFFVSVFLRTRRWIPSFLVSLVCFVVFGATPGLGEVGRCPDRDGLETSHQRRLDDLRYKSVAWYSTVVFLRKQGMFR